MTPKEISSFLAEYWQAVLAIFAGLAIAAAATTAIIWIAAERDSETKRADEHERKAAAAHTRSLDLEAQANGYRRKIEEKDKEIAIAREELKDAKQKSKAADSKTAERKKTYEEIRKKPVVVDDSNLDARESQLLARLREHQDSEGIGTGGAR